MSTIDAPLRTALALVLALAAAVSLGVLPVSLQRPLARFPERR